jgi:predicted nucleic acid-binding protein
VETRESQASRTVLLEYEVSAILRKAVVAGWLTAKGAADAMAHLRSLNIQFLPPTLALHERVLALAARLKQSKSHDAHYLALAEDHSAELWTAGKRLVNDATQASTGWVRWIGKAVACV